ncbi:RNA-binding S4 domain-containing protein [Stenotrophobium rhamnosiphilum]|uniref:Heat shock protein 15 n=1 Tax=Stenotrophobium rhamnosiphilum TaxID=2029166 RepID=A0A2T5MEH6_9GAMM|nr:S4 domain-containing protein [Stenotrophobium rhamnosiphilum]PTU30967.1 RNA-binding protein [Stenotrophobium rhamnosiphilum]
MNESNGQGVRLDKWLWAARFYKTRSLAKEAIEGGKVRYDGDHSKVGRDVKIGALIRVRQGYEELEVQVLALSDQRGAAPQARLLYEETPVSKEQRERAALERRGANALVSHERPSKQQRRMIHRFKRQLSE